MYHCKFDAEEWDTNEVSTRNCIHCKINPDEPREVYCDKGHKLEARGCSYSHRYIITEQNGKAPLTNSCQNCQDFNNRWEDE